MRDVLALSEEINSFQPSNGGLLFQQGEKGRSSRILETLYGYERMFIVF